MSQNISAAAAASRESARDSVGRFGPQATGESSVDLSCEPTERRDFGGLDEQELVDCCTKAASYWSRRYDVDEDDLRSDTMVAFLERVESSRGDESDGKGITAHRSYINMTAKSIALKQATGLKGGRNMKALSTYLRRRQEWEHENQGRIMTAAQEDSLAAEVRSSQPPGYRPPENFHRARKQHEYAQDEETLTRLGGTVDADQAAGVANVTGFPTGSVGERTEDLLESDMNARARTRAARMQAWDAIAEVRDAPTVARGALTSAEATRAQRAVKDAGGACAVADRLGQHPGQGPLTADQAALMQPFARQDPEGRRSVAALLQEFPDHADDLWSAAATASSTPETTEGRAA